MIDGSRIILALILPVLMLLFTLEADASSVPFGKVTVICSIDPSLCANLIFVWCLDALSLTERYRVSVAIKLRNDCECKILVKVSFSCLSGGSGATSHEVEGTFFRSDKWLRNCSILSKHKGE